MQIAEGYALMYYCALTRVSAVTFYGICGPMNVVLFRENLIPCGKLWRDCQASSRVERAGRWRRVRRRPNAARVAGRLTDIAKAVDGRNECTRMPSDSATSERAGLEINKEGNGGGRRDVGGCGRRGHRAPISPYLPPHVGHVIWGEWPVRVIKCRSVRARACFVLLMAAAVFLEYSVQLLASRPALLSLAFVDSLFVKY